MWHHAQLQSDFQNMQNSDLETVSPDGSCVASWCVLTYTLRLQLMCDWLACPDLYSKTIRDEGTHSAFFCSPHSALQTLCELSIWVELKKQEHQKQNEKHMTKPAKMCDICVKEWYPEQKNNECCNRNGEKQSSPKLYT